MGNSTNGKYYYYNQFNETMEDTSSITKTMEDTPTPNQTPYYDHSFQTIKDNEIENIRKTYKVVDVDFLDTHKLNLKIFGDEYFTKKPHKKDVIKEMAEFYLNDKEKAIYKKTDYLCNKKEKICICNINADNLRKIYEGINYKEDIKFISWCKKD
jgi:hypothetical protein